MIQHHRCRWLLLAALVTGNVLFTAAVAAQAADLRFELGAVGFVPGQQLRATVVHAGRSSPISAEMLVIYRNGQVAAHAAPMALAPSTFQSFHVPRGAVAEAGEIATGRIQVRVVIRVRPTTPVTMEQARTLMAALAPSLEVIDASSGRTSSLVGDVRTVISAEAAFDGPNGLGGSN